MDCERFDKVILDHLYGELDELTDAAARRHVEHCARCAPIKNRLRATREVGVLPMLAVPEGLAERIVSAEEQARSQSSLRERIGRAISIAAGYSMRPQLAMAALLVLMISGSFLFLRNKPGDVDEVRITERGVVEHDESVAIVPLPPEEETEPEPLAGAIPVPEPTPALGRASTESAADIATDTPTETDKKLAEDTSAFDTARAAYDRGHYQEARDQFGAIALGGGSRAQEAALHAALATRSATGCDQAAPMFDAVWRANQGNETGAEALWHAASCYRNLGQVERARAHLLVLQKMERYSARAEQSLAALEGSTTTSAQQSLQAARTRAQEPAKAAKPAAAAPPRKAKPAQGATGTQ